MLHSKRFAASIICFLMCGFMAFAIPEDCQAETAAGATPTVEATQNSIDEETRVPSRTEETNQSDVEEAPNSVEQNSENTQVSTVDDQAYPTVIEDGWHGGSGEPLWYQQNGERIANQWFEDNGNRYYFSASGEAYTGIHEIDGALYCFDDNGCMQVDWILYNNTWYYASPTGELDTGWLYDDGSWYLLGDDGAMLTGIQSSNNSDYLLQANGVMATGWGIDPVSGKWCLADKSGKLLTGWQYVGDAWYLLGSDDLMLTGLQRLGGSVYYLKDSGEMSTGWAWDSTNQDWYYSSASGDLVSGWQFIDSSWYWLDPQTMAMRTGWVTLKDKTYHLSSSGAMDTGWLFCDGAWYWLDNPNGFMITGWQQVSGAWYYMSSTDGKMQAGLLDLNGNKYYLLPSGAMATGWAWDNDAACWYLASSDPSDGRLLTGWQQVGATWYYLRQEDAHMATGWLEISGSLYYLKSSGAMAANEWVDYLDGAKLFMCSNGNDTFMIRNGRVYKSRFSNEVVTGWISNDGIWMYVNDDGSLAKGWIHPGSYYYLDPVTGVMLTGWIIDNNQWYWLNDSGAMVTGWVNIGTGRWQFDEKTGALHEPEQDPVTDLQSRVVSAAYSTPSPGGGLCAMWVSQVFQRAGLGYPSGDACDMYWQWCDKSDLRDLRVGMIIAIPSHTHTYMGGLYGHIGIYIGNGIVMDNVGYVRTTPLNEWIAYYTTSYSPQWGWAQWQALA